MINLTGRTDVPVPEDALRDLTALCRTAEVEFLVIGAAARDLVIHSRQRSEPTRATKDIDIAVAVRGDEDFRALAQVLDRRGRAPHKFIVHGIEIDVISFGGNEVDRSVTFSDGSVFDATGISEVHSTSVTVRFPHGTEVQAASQAALTALKILAWSERHADNPEDALDPATILTAISPPSTTSTTRCGTTTKRSRQQVPIASRLQATATHGDGRRSHRCLRHRI